MEKLIRELIEYQRTGHADELLVPVEASIGRRDLRGVSIKLLDWLRVEAIRSKSRGLDLTAPSSQILRQLVENDATFAAAFSIDNDLLTYNPSTDEAERKTVARIVRDAYNPPIMH